MKVNVELLEKLVATDQGDELIELLHEPLITGDLGVGAPYHAVSVDGEDILTLQGLINHVTHPLTGKVLAVMSNVFTGSCDAEMMNFSPPTKHQEEVNVHES